LLKLLQRKPHHKFPAFSAAVQDFSSQTAFKSELARILCVEGDETSHSFRFGPDFKLSLSDVQPNGVQLPVCAQQNQMPPVTTAKATQVPDQSMPALHSFINF
jgi:hypothetical protein